MDSASVGPDAVREFDPEQESRHVMAYLRTESLDLYNRIHSVAEDVLFVESVRQSYPDIPLLREQ